MVSLSFLQCSPYTCVICLHKSPQDGPFKRLHLTMIEIFGSLGGLQIVLKQNCFPRESVRFGRYYPSMLSLDSLICVQLA